MTPPRSTCKYSRRTRGGLLVALAAVMYLLLPGVFAAHAAIAHPSDHAAVIGDDSQADHSGVPDDRHEDSDPDGPHCNLCDLIFTVGHVGQAPAPTLSVAIDVTSYEYAFTPVTFCLPADLRAAPASPRAPPRL